MSKKSMRIIEGLQEKETAMKAWEAKPLQRPPSGPFSRAARALKIRLWNRAQRVRINDQLEEKSNL